MFRYDGTKWIEVRDTDIQASVDRLDEATVDVDGVATAKSSLVVNADGNIAGVRLSATNDPADPGSNFRIFADKFELAATDGQAANMVPFSVDTTTRQIKFNGNVEFSNIDGGDKLVTEDNLEYNIENNVTTIDGGNVNLVNLNASNIKTGQLDANLIRTGAIYNKGAVPGTNNYHMKIDLGDGVSTFGEIHIK